ncbi:hypothetical protein [Piscibacillus salipiscarius]|uniref:YqbF C-terminal domain-containing protein n=1 Tax=Piscibacillus salipiscarius TaxID=299480 RepID=A0ABW5Q8T9_9BACI|nr:hypothetical protein [Piscibacillus salipiscarius]
MNYQVNNRFRDTQDPNDSDKDKVIYEEGDPFPREGYEPSQERLQELETEHPTYKRVFIKKVEKPNKQESELLSKTDIRKMNKGPQEELIQQLGGNPDEASNEDERIELILKLQEQTAEESSSE